MAETNGDLGRRPAYRIPRPQEPLAVYNAKRIVNDTLAAHESVREGIASDLIEALDDLLRHVDGLRVKNHGGIDGP